MRALFIALALAACSQPHPQAQLAEPYLARMTYHCTPEGNEYVRFDYADETWEERMTHRTCDYATWRAYEADNGPVTSRGAMPSYSDWQRAQPEA